MMACIPGVHGSHNFIRLMNGDHGALCENGEIRIRYHGCYFNNPVMLGIQARHFKIDPNQVIFIHRHQTLQTSRIFNMR